MEFTKIPEKYGILQNSSSLYLPGSRRSFARRTCGRKFPFGTNNDLPEVKEIWEILSVFFVSFKLTIGS
jgi:hypothetical protein